MPPFLWDIFLQKSIPEIAKSSATWSRTFLEGDPSSIWDGPPDPLFCVGWLRVGARMFSFLGELISLAIWLFQLGCGDSRRAARFPRAMTSVWEPLPCLWVGSCSFSRPESAAHRLAIGPPWDRLACWCGRSIWSLKPAMVSIPSRRFIRG
jgi:hypothetical protein